jgi:hypothetical protein
MNIRKKEKGGGYFLFIFYVRRKLVNQKVLRVGSCHLRAVSHYSFILITYTLTPNNQTTHNPQHQASSQREV